MQVVPAKELRVPLLCLYLLLKIENRGVLSLYYGNYLISILKFKIKDSAEFKKKDWEERAK